jgi:AcrR family transcriptional regulator
MGANRQQGRPPKGESTVGRERIVDSVRELLKQPESVGLSRKNVAKLSGVTPALVTYYFPSLDILIEEAARPILDEYVKALEGILLRGGPCRERLYDVIHLLVRCYARSGRVIRVVRALAERDDFAFDQLEKISNELSSFLKELMESEGRQPSQQELDLLECAIHGMCEVVTRNQLQGGDGDMEALETYVSRRLFGLVENGLGENIALDARDIARTSGLSEPA